MSKLSDRLNNPDKAQKELEQHDRDCAKAYDKFTDSMRSQGYRVKESNGGNSAEVNLQIKRVK